MQVVTLETPSKLHLGVCFYERVQDFEVSKTNRLAEGVNKGTWSKCGKIGCWLKEKNEIRH